MARTTSTRGSLTRTDPEFPSIPNFQPFTPLVTGNPASVTATGAIQNMATQNPLSFIPQINTGVNAGGLPPALLKQTATSLSGALRGELPEDVQNLLRQQAAEYGVASGMGGSQFAGYAGLRNLGLTSLDRIKGAESILGNQFINPAQAQQLNLQAGTARAGFAQQGNELAQQLGIEQARLGQNQSQFSAGQGLERERLAQQAQLAALGESGANYRASLGLNSGGGKSHGSSGGGGAGFSSFVGGGTGSGVGYNPGGTGPSGGITLDPNYAPNFDTGPSNYDYNPYNDGGYDDGYGGGFENFDDVIDYYGY